MNIAINRDGLDMPIVAPSGEPAWTAASVSKIMDQANNMDWVVLGGDVITDKGQYTYDSWYYNQNPYICPKDNVKLSISKCLEYINAYIRRNQGDFYFVLVLTPASKIDNSSLP